VAASTPVAVAASDLVVERSVRAVAVAPSVRGAADFLVLDMLAFPAADLQEAGRWLAPQELSHRADLPIGILLDPLVPEALADQRTPEMSLDLLDVRLFKAGN